MTHFDAAQAEADARARAVLYSRGAHTLPSRPWQNARQPLTDMELTRYAAWVSRQPDVDAGTVSAGIRLLSSARAELDQVEAALLFAARAAGMTWSELAQTLGLRSAQAAQQRLDRVISRVDGGPGE